MLLQLKPLFTGEKENLSVDCSLDFSGIEWQGIHPFSQPVKVQGQISTSADVVVLKAKASWRFDGVCDRCAEPFCRDMENFRAVFFDFRFKRHSFPICQKIKNHFFIAKVSVNVHNIRFYSAAIFRHSVYEYFFRTVIEIFSESFDIAFLYF